MRNLKKILALALALVMTLSVMSFASATTYPDSDTITEKYAEAVDVLSSLKVFVGKDTGNFDPSANIKRSEVAAIIYRVVTGDVGDTNVGLYSDYNKFTDVTSERWYAGYVNYCANAEYIVGMGNNTFKPDANVTGYQVLAMILRAVGYDQNKEFQGSGWQVRVASIARELGITDTVSEVTLGQAVSREVVAELLFRTITLAPTVTYTEALGYNQYVNFAQTGAYKELNPTLGYKTFGLERTEGVISAVGRTTGTVTLKDWSEAANGTSIGSTVTVNTSTPLVVTGLDDQADWTNIGYQAYVYTVATKGVKTRAAVSDLSIEGVSLKVSTDGTAYGDLTATTAATATAGKIVVEPGSDVFYNGEYIGVTGSYVDANGVTQAQNANVTTVLGRVDSKGVKVDLIDNDDGGQAEVVVVTEYSVATVTSITNTTNTGTNGIVADKTYVIEHGTVAADREATTISAANLVTDATLAVGDLITYVEYPGSFKNPTAANRTVVGDYYVTEASLVTGTYTQANYDATTRTLVSAVIADNTYGISEANTLCFSGAYEFLKGGNANTVANNANTNIGKVVNAYLDPYGYILHVEESVAALNYLYVKNSDHSSVVNGTTYATVMYSDGTTAKAYLAGGMYDNLNSIVPHIYTYTTDANGNLRISNTAACLDNVNNHYTGNLSARTTLTTGVYLNNASVVINADNGTVYTGWSNLPTLSNVTVHYITNTSNVITLAYFTGGDTSVKLDFVAYTTLAHTGTAGVGGTVYNLPVIKDGEATTVTLSAAQYTEVCNRGVGIYSFTDDTLDSYTAFPEVTQAITWSDGLLLSNNTAVAYNDSTKLYTLDITNGAEYLYTMTNGQDATTIANLTHVVGTGSTKNAYIVYNANGTTAKEIYVVDGEYATAPDATNNVTAFVDNSVAKTYYVKNGLITVANWNEPIVSFYGVDAALANGEYTATATYGQAADTNNTPVSIIGGELTGTIPTFAADGNGVTYTGSILGKDGNTYTFSFTQSAATAPVLTLTANAVAKGTVIAFDDDDPTLITSGDADAWSMSINEFINSFETSDGAEVEWTFVNGQGEVDKANYDQTMDDVTSFSAVVTGEDGTKAVYGNEDGIKAAEQEMAEETVTEMFPTLDTYLSSNTTVKNAYDALMAQISGDDADLSEIYDVATGTFILENEDGEATDIAGLIEALQDALAAAAKGEDAAQDTIDKNDKATKAVEDSRFSDSYKAAGVTITSDADARTVTVTVDNTKMAEFFKNASSEDESAKKLINNMVSSTNQELTNLYAGIFWAAPTVEEGTTLKLAVSRDKSEVTFENAETDDEGCLYYYPKVALGTVKENQTHAVSNAADLDLSVLTAGYSDTLYFQWYTEDGVALTSVQAWTTTIVLTTSATDAD